MWMKLCLARLKLWILVILRLSMMCMRLTLSLELIVFHSKSLMYIIMPKVCHFIHIFSHLPIAMIRLLS